MPQRLKYIDSFRGIFIISVIMGHIFKWCTPEYEPSSLRLFFSQLQMPVFFFIMGLMAHNKKKNWTMKFACHYIIKKATLLLIPAITMFTLYVTTHNVDIRNAIVDASHTGYWFTFVAFEIFFIYALINILSQKMTTKCKSKNIASLIDAGLHLFLGGILFLMFKLSWRLGFAYNPFFQSFSLVPLCHYYLYFSIGIFCALYHTQIMTCFENVWYSSILLTSLFVYFLFPISSRIWLVPICLMATYMIFYNMRDYFQKENFLSNGLTTIGSHTLEIYLLHYWLLFPLPLIQKILLQIQLLLSPHAYALGIAEILLLLPISVLISYCCIALRKIIDCAPLVSKICFGFK